MKCPDCSYNQKHKDGMTCNGCGRQFALDPKSKPYLSDMAFHKAVEALSGSGHYYYTYSQLFAQIFRLLIKKARLKRVGLVVGPSILIILTLLYHLGFHVDAILIPGGFIGLLMTLICLVTSFSIKQSRITDIIQQYHTLHPLKKMVDGKQFQGIPPRQLDDEMVKYAPERILIVDANDIADMLILNRFHFQNKTLVVSAEKYPPHAFDACQRFMARHPDIPVLLIHDASIKGREMKERLLSDETWGLNPNNIQDLGLFSRDTERLKQPMWLPHRSGSKGDKILLNKKSRKNMQKGFRMPLDVAPPKAMMGALGVAAVAGMPLLSEALMSELQKDAAGTGAAGGWGGGFG